MAWLINRNGTWYMGQRVHGKDRYRSLGVSDKTEARRLMKVAEPIKQESAPLGPLAAQIEAFLDALTRKGVAPHTLFLYRNAFKHLTSRVGTTEDINPRTMAEFRQSLSGKAPATQGIILRNVKAFLAYNNMLTKELREILRPEKDTFKGRFISVDEEEKLLRACKPLLLRTVIFALETGLRLSQVWAVRWDQFDDGLLFVPGQKHQKDRHIVITPRARISMGEPAIDQERVFDGWVSVEQLMRTYMRTVRKSGIKGRLRFHDLRHTAASRLAEKLTPYELKDHFGWSSVALTDRYTHARIESIRKKLSG